MAEIDEKTLRFIEAAKVLAKTTMLIGTSQEPSNEQGDDILYEFITAYTSMMGIPDFDPDEAQLHAADDIIAGIR